jgi:hypothetical protein
VPAARRAKVTRMNELATTFLETYAAGAEPEGGWSYGKALQQAKLDYTPDSLKRLDALLSQIRERARPTRAQLDTVPGRNFESLVVFYLMEFARRVSHAQLQWHDLDSARRALPPGVVLDDSPANRLVVDAPASAVLFRPLEWLEARLLGEGEAVAPATYVASVLAQLGCDGPPVWFTTMFTVGRLGSWNMMMAADGQGVWPALVTGKAPMSLRPLERGDLTQAVTHCFHLLEDNPDNEVWQVCSYPGYAEHAGAKVDAVIVMGASHGPQPVRLAVAFPFRPAREGRPLVILQPSLVETNLPVEAIGKLSGALERGIRNFGWAVAGSWDEHYQA